MPRWLQSSVGGEAVCTQEWSKEKPAASQSRTLSHAASFFLMHSKTTRAGRSMYRFQETSASGRLSSNGRWAAMLLNSTRFLCSNPKVPLKNHACAGVPLIVKRWLPSSSWAEAKTEEREGGGLRRPQCEWSAWTLAESRFCYACLHGRNDYFTHAYNHAHSGRSLRKTSPAFLSVTGGSCPEGGRLSSQAARATANLESLQWENTHGCPLYIMLHCFDKRRERKKRGG